MARFPWKNGLSFYGGVQPSLTAFSASVARSFHAHDPNGYNGRVKFVGLILLASLALCCWIAVEAHNLLREMDAR